MITVLFRLIKFPDGRFFSSSIPLMFTRFFPTEEARLMHPLVWAASKDKGLLFPDTAARKIKTSIGKGSTEIESFGVCVENIYRSIICHRFVHASVQKRCMR